MTARWIAGPMVWLTAAIAAAWVGLGVYGLLMFPVAVSAVGIGFAVLGLLGAVLTGWLALSMVVRYGPFGVRVPGQGEVSWDDVESVELLAGALGVPAIGVRQGRALTDVQLGGLAWFGTALPLKLAQRLADAGDKGEVSVRGGSSAPGRRAA